MCCAQYATCSVCLSLSVYLSVCLPVSVGGLITGGPIQRQQRSLIYRPPPQLDAFALQAWIAHIFSTRALSTRRGLYAIPKFCSVVREMHHYSTCSIPLQDDNKCIFETGQQGSKIHQQLP